MAMARASLRVTHHPVAFVCAPDGTISLIAVCRDLPFIGGQRVAQGAATLALEQDSRALAALQRIFLLAEMQARGDGGDA